MLGRAYWKIRKKQERIAGGVQTAEMSRKLEITAAAARKISMISARSTIC